MIVSGVAYDSREILRRLWTSRARAFKRLAQVLKESDDNRYNTRDPGERAGAAPLFEGPV